MMETYRKEDIRRGDIYYSRLLGIDSIDEYIRYGGTLRAGELAFDDEDVNESSVIHKKPPDIS